MQDKYMKESDVSEMLKIPVGTLQAWRSRGKGPKFLKIEGCVRYDREQVMEWIECSTVEPDHGKKGKANE